MRGSATTTARHWARETATFNPIAVEDEGKPARAIFAVAGTEGKDADWGLLPLKLVHAADACGSWERGLKRADLGIVRGNEKKVLECQRSRAAILVSVEASK